MFISDKCIFNSRASRCMRRPSGRKRKKKKRIRDLAAVAAVGACGIVEGAFWVDISVFFGAFFSGKLLLCMRKCCLIIFSYPQPQFR